MILKAISDPTRRAVLEMLYDGPRSAGQLSERFSVSRPTMSAHFAVLREAGLVRPERDGKNIIYHLQMSVLEEALMAVVKTFGLNVAASERDTPNHKDVKHDH